MHDFLNSYPDMYVSVTEISRRLGSRGRRYRKDPSWARPILLRMEYEGLLEANEYGEFRIKKNTADTSFIEALGRDDPNISLGDTTIIKLEET